MICPTCGGELRVIDSEDRGKMGRRRWRKCAECGARHTSWEVYETRPAVYGQRKRTKEMQALQWSADKALVEEAFAAEKELAR